MNSFMKTDLRALACVMAVCAVLSGCGSDQDDLRSWMDHVRSTTQPIRERIAEPKRFEPFRYDDALLVDPFSFDKLQSAYARLVQRSRSGLSPDLNRRREALESYPLESIHMVGRLSGDSRNYALLQVGTQVFKAAVGNYAGQNYGVITKITDGEVKLKELVQDATGEWVQRETSLQLQEGSKK